MRAVLATVCLLAVAGCGGGGGGAGAGAADTGAGALGEPLPEPELVVPLLGAEGGLELGSVAFAPAEGEARTSVAIRLPYAAEPGQTARIVAGSCAEPGAVAYELAPLQAGASTTVIDSALEALEGSPHAVQVLAPDGAVAACGDVTATAAG